MTHDPTNPAPPTPPSRGRGRPSVRVADVRSARASAAGPSGLRLVGEPPVRRGEHPDTPNTPAERAARRVERENRAASRLTADDARLILAMRTSELIEGGKLAMLRPERRRRLVDMATRLGLRPFDAHLVIAIAQEAARRGEPIHSGDAAGRLRLVPVAGRGDTRAAISPARTSAAPATSTTDRPIRLRPPRELVRLLLSAALASALLIAAVRWLLG